MPPFKVVNFLQREQASALRKRVVQFVKNIAVLFTFGEKHGIIQLNDKLEFVGENIM